MSSWVARQWYGFCKVGFMLLFGGLFRLRWVGGHYLPKTGPIILVSNHECFLDPLFLGVASPRPLIWLTRETLHKNRLLSWFMSSLGSIPIDHRGFSREGLQQTWSTLNQDLVVGVFPEGERTYSGELEPFKPGISLLLKKTNATIVPAGIAGAYEAYSRHRKVPRFTTPFTYDASASVGIAFGPPIDPVKYAKVSREEMLADLEEAVRVQMARAEKIRNRTRRFLGGCTANFRADRR